jgi:CBS domain-containing protein
MRLVSALVGAVMCAPIKPRREVPAIARAGSGPSPGVLPGSFLSDRSRGLPPVAFLLWGRLETEGVLSEEGWAMVESEFAEAYEEDERAIRGAILSEPISALDPRSPVVVSPRATVGEAVRLMNETHRGCVLVVEGYELIGIFTERDLLRLVEQESDPAKVMVGKVMTRNPEVLRPDHGVALALNKMTVGGFRHIPLVDDQGRPVGIVAMRDIVRFMVSMFPDAVLTVPSDPSAIQSEYGG